MNCFCFSFAAAKVVSFFKTTVLFYIIKFSEYNKVHLFGIKTCFSKKKYLFLGEEKSFVRDRFLFSPKDIFYPRA